VLAAARQVVHAGQESQLEQAKEVLRETRRRLYRILADEGDGPSTTPPES
jgi:hypothetical protein